MLYRTLTLASLLGADGDVEAATAQPERAMTLSWRDVEAFVADRAGWLETLQAWLAGPGGPPFSGDARVEPPAGAPAPLFVKRSEIICSERTRERICGRRAARSRCPWEPPVRRPMPTMRSCKGELPEKCLVPPKRA